MYLSMVVGLNMYCLFHRFIKNGRCERHSPFSKKNITSFAESYRGWVCANSGTFHNGYYHLIKLWDVSIVLFFTNWKKTKWRKYSKFFLCHQWRKTCVCALFKFVYLTNDHSLTFCRLDPNVCTVHQNRILSREISGISNYI